MDYRIAVATSDGVNVNGTFGAADSFLIYEVTGGKYSQGERRAFSGNEETLSGCSEKNGACGGNHGGCGGAHSGGCGGNVHSEKVELISDCRSVVCTKIGFHVQKLLEKKAIAAFDVDCSVKEALDKITSYYSRIDKN